NVKFGPLRSIECSHAWGPRKFPMQRHVSKGVTKSKKIVDSGFYKKGDGFDKHKLISLTIETLQAVLIGGTTPRRRNVFCLLPRLELKPHQKAGHMLLKAFERSHPNSTSFQRDGGPHSPFGLGVPAHPLTAQSPSRMPIHHWGARRLRHQRQKLAFLSNRRT